MINYIESELVSLSIHHIGNKTEEEGIEHSPESLVNLDDNLEQILLSYFLGHYKEPEFHQFTYKGGDVVLNPIFNIANNIFNDPDCLHEQSIHIAKHLYQNSNHPFIKEGDIMVSYIHNVLVDDEMVDAITIVKTESKDSFLQLQTTNDSFDILPKLGINVKKIDKACVIFSTESEEGYKLCVIDKTNGKEAKFWTDNFLYIKPRPDAYHQTKTQINLTKAFIKERLQPLHEIDKTEEADILNRSHKFFKNNEAFSAENYEEKVFKEEQTIAEFQAFKDDFQEERRIEVKDEFPISQQAVKKQSRIFKSILKLDKNFHIYIHGNREMIQKGTDDEGRKYYQVFYEEEK